MAKNTVKSGDGYTEGAEFRFLGNLFGSLMACAGLLAGTMMHERSIDYWLDDIVPLLLLSITLRGLIKSALELAKDSIFYEEQKKQVLEALARQEEMAATMAESELELPRISTKPKYSEEEVLEAVSKRIEQQREEGLKKNKVIN